MIPCPDTRTDLNSYFRVFSKKWISYCFVCKVRTFKTFSWIFRASSVQLYRIFFFRKFPGIYLKFLNHYQWNCITFPLKPLREMTWKFYGNSLWEFWSLVYKYMPGLALYHSEILHTYANIVRVISVPCIEQPHSERHSSYRSIRELRVIARLRGISLKVLSKFLGGLFSTLFFVFGAVKGNYGQHSGIWPTCTVP